MNVPHLSDEDRAEIAASIARNREDRMAYVDFKVRWLRQHVVLPPGKPPVR